MAKRKSKSPLAKRPKGFNQALSGKPMDVLSDPLVQMVLSSMGGVNTLGGAGMGGAEFQLDDMARHPENISNMDDAMKLLDYTKRQYGMLPQYANQIDDFASAPHDMQQVINFLKGFM